MPKMTPEQARLMAAPATPRALTPRRTT